MKPAQAYFIHPWLFAILPVPSLYLENVDEAVIHEIARPIAFLSFTALVAYALLARLIENHSKAALLVSISWCLIFLYRGLYESFYYVLGSFEIWRFGGYAALLSIVLIWVTLTILITTANRIPISIHYAMNAVALGSLIALSGTILQKHYVRFASSEGYQPPHVMTYDAVFQGRSGEARSLPDIVYIVLDRYPNTHTLLNFFGFDNSDFTMKLRARGFFVADGAFANYAKTYQSLASMLNMSHLPGTLDPGSADHIYNRDVYNILEDHNVQRLLRQKGYRFIHMGSFWTPTAKNRFADQNFPGRQSWLNEFEIALLRMTPILDLRAKFRAWQGLSPHLEECERVLRQIEYLRKVGGEQRPTFVFAHILVPHVPFRFDEHGNCIAGPSMERGGSWEEFKRYFVGQVKFINQGMLSVIDEQVSNNRRGIVLILQSDEGPFPPAYYEHAGRIEWETWTPTDFAVKYGILNAFYWADRDYDDLRDSLTPVNNWRMIFNKVFETSLPMVQNRAYGFETHGGRLEFFDVTGAVERGVEEWVRQEALDRGESQDVPGAAGRQETFSK